MIIDEYSIFGKPTKKHQKPTEQTKRIVATACEPLIEKLKNRITSIPEEQLGNHLIDIYGKWFRNQYHIYLKYQCSPNNLAETFESGLARLGWIERDAFIVSSFMAHRNKWEAFYENIPLTEAIKRIEESDFLVFNNLITSFIRNSPHSLFDSTNFV